jgi:hypothetical protein
LAIAFTKSRSEKMPIGRIQADSTTMGANAMFREFLHGPQYGCCRSDRYNVMTFVMQYVFDRHLMLLRD